jgi:hypothetical protein
MNLSKKWIEIMKKKILAKKVAFPQRAEYHFINILSAYIEEALDCEINAEVRQILNKIRTEVNHYEFNQMKQRRVK